mgnify:CR=1 FL=1
MDFYIKHDVVTYNNTIFTTFELVAKSEAIYSLSSFVFFKSYYE